LQKCGLPEKNRSGRHVAIGEVAASAARDQDLLADLLGMVEQQDPSAALARPHRTHQARGAAAQDDDVERLVHASALPMIQSAAARPAIAPATEPPT
jgi:hypothetical protein